MEQEGVIGLLRFEVLLQLALSQEGMNAAA